MSSNAGRIRVGLYCPCLVMGGAESWQLALARYVDPGQVEWVGCCVVGGYGTIEPAMEAATEALMPVTRGLDAARSLADRCDVLVAWAIDDIPAILRGMASRPAIVSVIHAPAESEWGQAVYAQAEGVDHWVAVSELALSALPESSRTVPSSVIWNAVDASRLAIHRDRATMRASWGVPVDAPVAGYLGRFSVEKNPGAMARLARSLPEPWRVVMVGNHAEWTADKSGLILPGPDLAAGDVLNAFDVLVVPSFYESFGLTIAEGICLEKPIVSTEVGLAKLVPGMSRIVPVDADGPTLATAVLGVFRGDGPIPVGPEADALRERLAPGRFGREWTELLVEVAPPMAVTPTLVDKATSLVVAIVRHVANGAVAASPETQAHRKAICVACPNSSKEGKACEACGCGMIGALSFVGLDMDLKRSMPKERCPLKVPLWVAEP